LFRFHLSNGTVSLAGNLVLMRLLVHGARMHLLVSNGIAILCCSVVNFYLGDRWAFEERSRSSGDGSTSESTDLHIGTNRRCEIAEKSNNPETNRRAAGRSRTLGPPLIKDSF
jgi:GtrA-like protein